jgi:hypothetical protein
VRTNSQKKFRAKESYGNKVSIYASSVEGCRGLASGFGVVVENCLLFDITIALARPAIARKTGPVAFDTESKTPKKTDFII